MKLNLSNLEKNLAQKIFTSKMLAEKSGLSETTISRIKRGAQNAKPETIGKIAQALGVDVDELLETK